ncbi:probable ATP-dependent DNA helicase HFM1 [Pelobates cultripes]|uniref:Probable ATP-dependent DNA helicase HFM1 n=1 Tax=Pelobates cultripes TaxID=61616 RepID=A0AAD1WK16_PELCU|nr:probable ATP-dependent DNA helicase HFM1 [Pelobates cultripes]
MNSTSSLGRTARHVIKLVMIVNRHPPFGNQIKESVMHLPKYEIGFEQLARYSPTVAEIVITILLTNFEQLLKKRTASDSHHVTLIIGDADNQVIFKQKIMDSALLKTGSWTRKIEIKRASKSEEISVNLISSEYVAVLREHYSIIPQGSNSFSADINDQLLHSIIPQGSNSLLHNGMFRNTDRRKDSAHQSDWAMPNSQTAIKIGMRECNHHCRNKDACGHDCCKTGVSHKADIKTNSNFASYLSDLRSRNSVSSAPPVKRLKNRQTNQNILSNQSDVSTSLKTPEKFAIQLDHSTANYTHSPQDGAAWKYSESASYEKHETLPSAIKTARSNLTDADKSNSWPAKSLNVTFDLGNDVWADFDDDKLIDASNIGSPVEKGNLVGGGGGAVKTFCTGRLIA